MERIIIVFTCDENYVRHTATVIASILQNSSRAFRFYIFDCGISPESLQKLQTWELGDQELMIVPMKKNDLFERYNIPSWYSHAIFYRLMIPDRLPEYDKVLYLDSDMVVCGDIGELWDIDLGDRLIGGVDEAVFFSGRWYEKRKKINGFPEDRIYFNSGVLLMNTKALREWNFFEKIVRVLQERTDLHFPDQDALNFLLENSQRLCFDCRYNFLLPLNVKKSLQSISPVIVHLIMKPWNLPVHLLPKRLFFAKYARKYFEYIQRTPFASQATKEVSYRVIAKVFWKLTFQPIETFARMKIRDPFLARWKR